MQPSDVFLLTKLVIWCILQSFVPSKALMGSEVVPVEANQFPSTVCIAKYAPEQNLEDNIYCTGTLLTAYHILTAERCFYDVNHNPIQVIVGTDGAITPVISYPIWWLTYDIWANYNRHQIRTTFNDIAITKIMGIIPQLSLSFISELSPLNNIEGFHVELYGCKANADRGRRKYVTTARTRVLQRENCEFRISQLEGRELKVPDNYVCSLSSPHTHLEQSDTGGPVVFFNSIIGINIGLFPPMGGEDNQNKVNAHLGVEAYRSFIHDVSTH